MPPDQLNLPGVSGAAVVEEEKFIERSNRVKYMRIYGKCL